uniref:leucine-rich repeat domain-containing protein n=1 Tax=Anaerofustis stercorihominis TaxID=214853 RepID=UPI002671DD14
VKDNEKAVITDKYEQDKTSEDVKAEESTSLNETSKTVKSSSKTVKAVVTKNIDETTGLEFSYNDTNKATITGIGSFSGDVLEIPKKVKASDTGEYDVTAIGEAAFSGKSLTSVEIPNNVISIGASAFNNCTSLTACTFEKGSKLTSISIYTFYNCNKLEEIIIPNSVMGISYYAFSLCSSLTKCIFEKDSSLRAITEHAFEGSGLKSIEIPKSVISLESNVFKDCTDLTSCTFENGINLTEIKESTFENSGLNSFKIPKTVETIQSDVFKDCTNLTSIDSEEGSVLKDIYDCVCGDTNLKTIRLTSDILNAVNIGYLNDTGDFIHGVKFIGHSGNIDDDPSPLYRWFRSGKDDGDGSWEFSSEGVCHGTSEVTETKVEPTCAKAGSITYSAGTCSCGNEISEQVTVEIPATGNHTFDKTVVDKVATCAEEGSKHVQCSVCNTKKENSDETIGVIPHKFDKEVVDKEATYTEEGSKHTECSVCGTKKEGSDVVIQKLVKKDESNNNNNNGDSTSNGITVTNTGSDKTSVNNPQTSDEMNMVLYVLLGLVSLGAVGTVGYKIKKRNI